VPSAAGAHVLRQVNWIIFVDIPNWILDKSLTKDNKNLDTAANATLLPLPGAASAVSLSFFLSFSLCSAQRAKKDTHAEREKRQ